MARSKTTNPISKPHAGETITVHAIPDQNIELGFILDQVQEKIESGQVIFEFEDGGKVVINFTDIPAQNAPEIIFADGTQISVQELLAAAETDIEPAGGPGGAGIGGGGISEYNDDAGDPINGVAKLDGLDPRDFSSSFVITRAAIGNDSPVEDAPADANPIAAPDSNTVDLGQNQESVSGNILLNDTLIDAPVVLTTISYGGAEYDINESTVIIGSYGTLTLSPNGNYTYTPFTNAPDGASDSFVYTIVDADGDPASTTLTLSIDKGPVAVADENSVDLGQGKTFAEGNVLDNDDTTDNPTVTSVTFNGTPYNVGTDIQIDGDHGALHIFADGSYTYTPFEEAIDGEQDVFSYTITDADGDTSSANLTLSIDKGPVAVADENSVDLGQGKTFAEGNVLDNDDKTDNPTVTSVTFNGTPYNVGTDIQIDGDHGALHIFADGSYTYTPFEEAIDGEQDVFSYTITDADGDTSSANLTLSIDKGPVAVADENSVDLGQGKAFAEGNVLDNDDKTDNPTVTSVTFNGTPYNVGTDIQIDGDHGALHIFADGSYTYTPFEEAIDGEQDVFSYTITDADGDTSSANLTLSIDKGPVAVADENSVDLGQGKTFAEGNVLDNDDKTDNPTVTSVTFNGTPYNVGTDIQIDGDHGALHIFADGSYTYTPFEEAIDGEQDVFSYTITDADGDTSSANLTLSIDKGPVAVNDTNAIQEGSSIPAHGNIASNDTIADAPHHISEITINGVTFLYSSTTTVNSDGHKVVTADTEHSGIITINLDTGEYWYSPATHLDHVDTDGKHIDHFSDTVHYTIADADGDIASASLTININDSVPTAVDDLHIWNGTGSNIGGNVITGIQDHAALGATPGIDIASHDSGTLVHSVTWHNTSIEFSESVHSGTIYGDHNSSMTFYDDGRYIYNNGSFDPVHQDLFTNKYGKDGVSLPENMMTDKITFIDGYGYGIMEGKAGNTGESKAIEYSPGSKSAQGIIFGVAGHSGEISITVRAEDYNNSINPYSAEHDRFAIDTYDKDGKLIHSGDNKPIMIIDETQAFTTNISLDSEIYYVGIRALSTAEEEAAGENVNRASSAFYIQSVTPVETSETIHYTLTDHDHSVSNEATLTLKYTGEIP